MSVKTRNLGQIAAIWISSNAPDNHKLIWYDISESVHKVYENSSGEWKALNPQIVTNSTIDSLRTIATGSGLSVGKFYFLTDVGTLAIAITSTKIWYVDSLNNYVVNDLAATITAYINSNNLLIDGSTGVWNNETGRLDFRFTETSGADLITTNDYIVIRRNYGSSWQWIKSKLSGFISAVSDNSITWNRGFYFSFLNSINSIKNTVGGIVGYEQYIAEKRDLQRSIETVSQTSAMIFDAAKAYTDEKTSEDALDDTVITRPWSLINNPPSVPGEGTTLHGVLNILLSWANVLKKSDRITIGSGFSSNGRSGNVNYLDTVRSAIEKLVYHINLLYSKFYTYDNCSWTAFIADDEYAQNITTPFFRVKDGLLTIRLIGFDFSNDNLTQGSTTFVVPLGFFPSNVASKFINTGYFITENGFLVNAGNPRYYYSVIQVIKSITIKQSNDKLVNINIAILFEYNSTNSQLTGRVLLGMYALSVEERGVNIAGNSVQFTDGTNNTVFHIQNEVWSLSVNALFQ